MSRHFQVPGCSRHFANILIHPYRRRVARPHVLAPKALNGILSGVAQALRSTRPRNQVDARSLPGATFIAEARKERPSGGPRPKRRAGRAFPAYASDSPKSSPVSRPPHAAPRISERAPIHADIEHRIPASFLEWKAGSRFRLIASSNVSPRPRNSHASSSGAAGKESAGRRRVVMSGDPLHVAVGRRRDAHVHRCAVGSSHLAEGRRGGVPNGEIGRKRPTRDI